MPFGSSKADRAFAAVFFLAVFLRFYQIGIPFVEPYNNLSRQAISASVARNFYERGFNFFYPEIDENGPGPYLFVGEMPFYSYAMALGYKLAGGAREGVARSVSALFSLGTMLALYLLTKRLYSGPAGLLAAAVFAFSPLGLALSRAVQPESAMLFFSAAALYTFHLYLETGRGAWYALSAGMFFLAVGTKFYNAYLLLPLAAMAWQREGWKIFSDRRWYAYAAFSLPAVAWYACMWHLSRTEQLAYIVYKMNATRGPEDMSYLQILFSPHYLKITAKIFLVHLLTPLGIVLALANGLKKFGGGPDRIARTWLFSAVLLMLVFWRTVIDHSYYQLPLLLPFSVLAGRGGALLWERRAKWKAAVLPAALVIAAQFFVLARLYPGIYRIPPERAAIVKAGRAAQRIIPKDSLTLGSYQTSTVQLYYCDRKGWAFDLEADDAELIRRLEDFRARKAEFFVISTPADLRKKTGFDRHLARHYPLVDSGGGEYGIFDLRKRLSPG